MDADLEVGFLILVGRHAGGLHAFVGEDSSGSTGGFFFGAVVAAVAECGVAGGEGSVSGRGWFRN